MHQIFANETDLKNSLHRLGRQPSCFPLAKATHSLRPSSIFFLQKNNTWVLKNPTASVALWPGSPSSPLSAVGRTPAGDPLPLPASIADRPFFSRRSIVKLAHCSRCRVSLSVVRSPLAALLSGMIGRKFWTLRGSPLYYTF